MLRNPSWEKRFLRLALLERHEKDQAVTEELRTMTESDNLVLLFDEFMNCVSESIHSNTESYMHDNGFDKIVLFSDAETRMKMRLHIWRPMIASTTKRPRQNVHNHRWDFSSCLLIGHADHLTYRFADVDEPGEEFFHYRYYARGSKEHYEVEGLGKSKLVCVGNEHMASGSIYSVKNEVLHRVDIPDDELVATLIITHENVGWVTNDLLSERSLGFSRTTLPSPMMTKEALLEKVANLRQHMGI